MALRPVFLAALSASCLLAGGALAAPKKLPKAEELLKGHKSSAGFYRLHWQGHRGYLEVPSSQLKRPFLLATSITGGPSYTGFQWGETVCAWEKVDDTLALLELEVHYRVKNSRKPMAEVVKQTYTDRVIETVPIVAMNGSNPVIDLNRLFAGKAKSFFGPVAAGFSSRLVKLAGLKAFPKNVEIALTVPDARRDGRLTTLAYSLSSLPNPGSDRYRPRAADDRVGYFLTAVKDFTDETAGGDRFLRFINRWKLDKADSSLERSPVREPIIFYVEKTVPFRYRQAITEGILEWNKAFEAVGLLGAIVVRQQTKLEFADLDPQDVRYNFFRWIVSERAFAMGPSRVNPWSGQILDADIVFDESMVRSYLREYDLSIKRGPSKYFSPRMQRLLREHPQRYPFAHVEEEPEAPAFPLPVPGAEECGLGPGVAHQLAVGLLALGLEHDLLARGKREFPQEFLDQIVKDVVMHEVGHTLGLRHNFKASTYRSLEEINCKDAPGAICGSVMDYTPVNVRAELGEAQGNYAMRTLGPYDYLAIRYGYDGKESEARKACVAQVASPQYAYATDEDAAGPDPYVARWDLGADPLAHAAERMTLARGLWGKAVDKVVPKGAGYREARRAIDMLLYDYQSAAMTAARFVGGQHVHRDHRGDPGARPPVVPVDAAIQRKALQLVCEQVLAEGSFSFPPELLQQLGRGHWNHWGSRDLARPHAYPYHDRILTIQSWALWGVLNPETLESLLDSEAKVAADADLLTLPEVFAAITQAVFGPLLKPQELSGTSTARQPLVSTTQRNLQRFYVGQLVAMVLLREGTSVAPTVQNLARLEARGIMEAINAVFVREGQLVENQPLQLDAYTRGHLDAMRTRIRSALEASYRIGGGY